MVAIDGRSGAGKSTLAEWLARQLDATHVDQDDFYAPRTLDDWRSLTPRENADRVIDWDRLRTEALLPLRAGRRARWRPFDWETMTGLTPEPVSAAPAPIVLLDGTYSAHPALAELADLTVLVTVPEAIRRAQLFMRAEDEDDDPIWQELWDAAEEAYFMEVRPPSSFDLVLR